MMSTSSLCTIGLSLLSAMALTGCTHTVKVEPIKVEPIDITLHIYLEADRKLDDFFKDVDKPGKSPAASVSGSPEQTKGAK